MSRHSATVTVCLLTMLGSAVTASVVDDAVNDMKLNHEGAPYGVPSYYDWRYKGKVSKWTPPWNANAITIWGQIYEDAGRNYAVDARVALYRHKLWVRYGSTWYKLQDDGDVSGAAYWGDFRDNSNVTADRRNHGSGSSLYPSFRAGGVVNQLGRNVHTYSWYRAGQNPSTQRGVCAQISFALINGGGTDDRSNAKYLVNVGADYYTDTSWGTNLYDVGMSRFLYARTWTRKVTMHNLSESDFRSSHPADL